MTQRHKTVYRDKVTNRLIHKKVAEQRDPSTWTEEQFTFSNHQNTESISQQDAYAVREGAR